MLAIWSLVLFFPVFVDGFKDVLMCVCVLFFPLYLLMVSRMCMCVSIRLEQQTKLCQSAAINGKWKSIKIKQSLIAT